MKKRVLSVILASMVALGLAACGSSGSDSAASSASSAPKETAASEETAETEAPAETEAEEVTAEVTGDGSFVIGFPNAPIDVPSIKAIEINFEKVAEAAGGSVNNEVFDFTPEGTVDAVEKLIAKGVKGVKITPSADTIIPTVLNMCDEAGVYFILSMRTIGDESILERCSESEYFLGCVYEDDYQAGYDLGKALADSGATTYALIGTSVGDTTGDTREKGLAAAAEEFGLTQVAEVRALEQASDATQAVESFIASYPDLDGIVRIASTAAGDVSAICSALKEAGKSGEVKFVTIDSEVGCEQYFEDGTLTTTLGNVNSLDSVVATSILVNAIQGNKVSDMPVDICIPFPVITTGEELALENTYAASEDGLYPESYLQENFLGVSLDAIQAEVDQYSPSYVATLWEK